jgi:hydrogenase-4 membrane subunit HyfE
VGQAVQFVKQKENKIMKKFALNTLAVLVVMFGLVIMGHAGDRHHMHIAPEIDPAMGTAALTLLSGAILVIRGRRKA